MKEEKDKLIFNIPGKRIKPAVKYRIFISPILAALKKQKPVEIRVDDELITDISEDKKSFFLDM